MNFFNRLLFSLVLSPEALYRRMGLQTDKMAIILQVKLMMDDRRPNTFNQKQRTEAKKKDFKRANLWGILGYSLMGLLFLYSFFIPAERLLQLTLWFSMFIVMLAMLLITDTSSLLLDDKDNTIILPTPVNARTLLVARLLHIVVVVLRTGLPLMLGGWVTTGIKDGWKAALIFPPICLLAILFIVFLVNCFYLVVLRFLSVERFKNMITSMQIVLSIVVFASYQLLPRLIDNANLESFSFATRPWAIYFPSQWFAALYMLVVNGTSATSIYTGAALAALFPLLAIYILTKYLAPAFNRKIGMINSGQSEKPLTQKQKAVRKKGRSLANVLSGKLTGSHTEEAAFRLAWNISSRSREFKMKVYPSLGYQLVYLFVFFVGGKRSISLEGFREMDNPSFFLMLSLIYMSAFSITTIITQMQMSEKPKAAWVFFTAPLHHPGQVISGAYKAMIVKFLVPVIVFLSLITMLLSGGKIAPHLLIGFANVLFCCTIFGYLFLRKFPFSMPIQTNVNAGNLLLALFVMFLPLTIGFLHGFFRNHLLSLSILAIVLLGASVLLLHKMQQRTWTGILSTYSE